MVLKNAGIDTDIFIAHSVRGASTTAAVNNIVPPDDVMKMADLSHASTFQTFYYKPIFKANYTFDVASSALLLSIFSYPAPLLQITRQGVEFYLIFSHMFRTEFV